MRGSHIFLFILAIIFVIVAPYLFTRQWGLISFKDTGTIGDTIGGITAPITSLIGSVIVFLALKAQIDANRLIEGQIVEERGNKTREQVASFFFTQINHIRYDINKINYSYKEKDKEYKLGGEDALVKVFQHLIVFNKVNEPFIGINRLLTRVYNILLTVDLLINNINASRLTEQEKSNLVYLISYQYNLELRPSFTGVRNTIHGLMLENPQRATSDIKKFYDLVDSIQSRMPVFYADQN